MSKDNVIAIKKPDTFVDDPISEILRQGARNLISQALEIELELFINQNRDLSDQMGPLHDHTTRPALEVVTSRKFFSSDGRNSP
jgi:hypothetical protein